MRRWATKDHYELETEEADRLVRPAPKVKPPRRDKRREDTQPDRDPDIDTDPDVARDKDLSQNCKSIGGRVLASFIRRRLADSNLIKVRHKDTGKVVMIKPETFKKKPSEYESLDDEDAELDSQMLGELLSDMPPPSPKNEAPAPAPPLPSYKRSPATEVTEVAPSTPDKKPPPAPEAKPAKPAEKSVEFYQNAGRELYDAAKTDLHLQGILKNLRDPKSELSGMAVYAPNMAAAPFLKGKKIPDGIETLGDLQKAVLHGRNAPKPKPGEKSEGPPKEAPKEEPGATPTQKSRVENAEDRLDRALDRLEQQHKSVPPEYQAELDKLRKELTDVRSQLEKAKPGEPAEGPAKPPKGGPDKGDAQARKIVEDFKAQEGGEDPEWIAHLNALPTTTTDAEGKTVFIDPKTKKEVPFDNLPESAKADLISSFQKKRHSDYTSALLASKLQGNDKARELVEGLFDPESEVSQKIASLREEGHDLEALPARKNLPELADVIPASVKTVADFQRLVEGHADLFKKRTPVQVWEKENGPETEAFKQYASEHGATEQDGQLLFRVGKKALPWGKLSEDQKEKLHDGFQKAENATHFTEAFTDAARHDPDVAYALYQLGNPRSEVAARLSRVTDINDPIIDKALPSLRNLALPPGATMQDVVEIAKRAFKPVPQPEHRREVTKDEMSGAQYALKKAFSKYPLLGVRVAGLGLHPDDVSHVLGTYQRAKAMKLKPAELQEMIKDAHKRGLYTTDPTSIVPPKSGRDKNGNKKSWNALTPEEQADSFVAHRNEVIATTLALRDMVNDTFRELGVPRNFSDTLALASLSRIPGEPNAQRAVRARPMATKLFDKILETNTQPQHVSSEDVQRTLDAIGDDPLTRSLAVAQFQANDYLLAREKFLDPSSPDHTDERDPARNIAARIREASNFLGKADERYPVEFRAGNTPELYRQRVMSRLTALTPEKAEEIRPEVQKMDADDYDDLTAAREEALKKWAKSTAEFKKAQAKAQREFDAEMAKRSPEDHPYKSKAGYVKSVKDRLAEAGIQEPIPPLPLPPKPAGYDLVRKTPRGQAQSGASLWRRLRRGLSASERVAERFLSYSSCAPGKTMGATTPSGKQAADKTGLYWGVDPNDAAAKAKAVNVPHRPWEQAHARDLSEKDYSAILGAAREWMKVPVLARVLDEKESLGAVKDIQLRAALDLAIRDMDGGKYSVGLHPTVYNNLLAQLAGQPEKGTLLTQRAASGSLYTPTQGEDRPMNAAAEIRKFAAEIAAQSPGLAFDLTNLAFRVAEQEGQQGQGQQDKEDKKPDFLKDKEAGAKYASLRGAVIKIAHENPAVRPALVPVLQLLKQHQGG